MTHEINRSLHRVQSTEWKDAVITLLEPSSPYWPGRADISSANEGDLVAYVLDTDPASVLTETARVGADGDPLAATFDRPLHEPTLME